MLLRREVLRRGAAGGPVQRWASERPTEGLRLSVVASLAEVLVASPLEESVLLSHCAEIAAPDPSIWLLSRALRGDEGCAP